MRISTFAFLLAAAILLPSALARAEDKSVKFDDAAALTGWTIKGDATIDAAKNRDGAAGGSLKLAPGAKASLKVSETDSAGTVEFWAFEDGTVAGDPKAPAAGAYWGLTGSDGKGVVFGVLYAKYLGGDTTYAAGNVNTADPKDSPVRKVQFLGVKRAAGWHKWTLRMDAEKGLSVLVDGKDINAAKARFDWAKTPLAGIGTLVLSGDATKDGKQVLWIDDLTVTLTGPMKAKGEGPAAAPAAAPAAPAAPAKDPANFTTLPPMPAE